nr:TPA_asm: hypothetical protein [Procofluvi virus]
MDTKMLARKNYAKKQCALELYCRKQELAQLRKLQIEIEKPLKDHLKTSRQRKRRELVREMNVQGPIKAISDAIKCPSAILETCNKFSSAAELFTNCISDSSKRSSFLKSATLISMAILQIVRHRDALTIFTTLVTTLIGLDCELSLIKCACAFVCGKVSKNLSFDSFKMPGSEMLTQGPNDDSGTFSALFDFDFTTIIKSAVDHTTLVWSLVSAFLFLLAGQLFSIPTCTLSKNLPVFMTAFKRTADGFKAVQQVAEWAVSWIQNTFYKYMYGITKDEHDLVAIIPQFEKYCKGVRILQTLPGDAFMISKDLCERVKLLYRLQRDCELNILKKNKLIPRESQILFYQVQRTFCPIYENAKKSPHFDDVSRNKPMSLYLYGRSGVGKSQFVNLATAVLAKKIYADKQLSVGSALWTRRATNEFWDGYANQPFIQYDDFLQKVDTVAAPNPEIMEMIDLINDAPLQLHMAELSQKSSTYFTSDHVWATTNTKIPNPVSIKCADALRRRFDGSAFEVSVDPAFGKRVQQGTDVFYRLDTTKTLNCLDKRVWKISEYDITTGTPIYDDVTKSPRVYDFDGFIERYLNDWNFNKSKNFEKSAALNLILGNHSVSKTDRIESTLAELDLSAMITQQPSPSVEEIVYGPMGEDYEDDGSFDAFLKISPTAPDDELCAMATYVKDYFDQIRVEYSHISDNDLAAAFTKAQTNNMTLSHALESMNLHIAQPSTQTEEFIDVPDLPEDSLTWKDYFKVCWKSTKSFLTDNFKKMYSKVRFTINRVSQFVKDHPYWTAFVTISTAIAAAVALWKLNSNCNVFSKKGAFACLCRTECANCDVVKQACGENILAPAEDLREKLFDYNVAAYRILSTQADTEENKAKAKTQATYWNDLYDATFNVQVARLGNRKTRQNRLNVEGYTRPTQVMQKVEGYTRATPFMQKVEGYSNATTPRMTVQITPEIANMECQIGKETTTFYDFLMKNVTDASIQQVLPGIISNTCVLKMKGRAAVGMFVEGRIILVPRHYYHWIEEEGGFHLKNMFADSPGQYISKDDCNFTYLDNAGKDTDAMLITCPLSVPSHKKLTPKFIDASQLPYVTESEVTLCRVRLVNERPVLILDNAIPHAHEEIKAKDDKGVLHAARSAYSYEINTSPGDCGCILITRSQNIARKIIGIHVSGNKTIGAAASVTQEMLRKGLAASPERFRTSLPEMVAEMPETTWGDDFENLTDVGDVIHHGFLPKHPHQPTRTEIKPSPLQAILQPKCKPAFLAPVRVDEEGRKIDPMRKGLKKVANTQANVPDDLLDLATNDVYSLMKANSQVEPRVLTYEEAIVGVEDDDYINPLIRKTSAGYPWNMNTKLPGKTKWLSQKDEQGKPTDEYKTDDPELKEAVMERLKEARENMRYPTYYVATLKDERRPIEKVNALKTRVFTAAPLDFTIAFRMFFSDFIADCMANRVNNEIAVGLDANTEWDYLAKELLAFGDGGFVAGDFSNFDGSLLQKVLWRVLDVINEWYDDGEENQRIRRVLFEECCNSLVLCHGHIIQWTHSQPSGNPGTTIINSLFQMIMFRVCYLTAKKENALPLSCDFRDKVKMVTYGDDGVLSVHPDVRDIFNQSTITKYMKQYGLTYTNEAKNDTKYTLRNLEEVSFLKRGFRNDAGTWTAPLDLDTIIEMCLWVKGPLTKVATIENVHNAFRELVLHGPETYRQVSNLLAKACWEVDIHIRKPTFVEMWNERITHLQQFAIEEEDPRIQDCEFDADFETQMDTQRVDDFAEEDEHYSEYKEIDAFDYHPIVFGSKYGCSAEYCTSPRVLTPPSNLFWQKFKYDFEQEDILGAWCLLTRLFPFLNFIQQPIFANSWEDLIDIWDGECETHTTFYIPQGKICITTYNFSHWNRHRLDITLISDRRPTIKMYLPLDTEPLPSEEENPRVIFVRNFEQEPHDAAWIARPATSSRH